MAEWKNRLKSRFSGRKAKDNEKKLGKSVSFERTGTVHCSDRSIVDVQHITPHDIASNHVGQNGKTVQLRREDKHLTQQQVIYMLKHRFKDDLDAWQSKKDKRPVEICSEPSRSPMLSRHYGHVSRTAEVPHPNLPQKVGTKLAPIWLQCGETIKQVQFSKEPVTLDYIRKIFQDNFVSELKQYAVGADRGMLLIRDPFTRTFKGLDDVRHVFPGSHLKLLAAKKKPCCSPEHEQLSKSFSYDERRRSRSLTHEASGIMTSADLLAGPSRARGGSYSFQGSTKTGYIVAPKRHVLTNKTKGKMNYDSFVHPRFSERKSLNHVNECRLTSPDNPETSICSEMSLSQYQSVDSSTVILAGVESKCTSDEFHKYSSRNHVEEHQLNKERLRTDGDIQKDIGLTNPRKYRSPVREKMRSGSDTDIELYHSNLDGQDSFKAKMKPSPPYHLKSEEKTSSQAQQETLENKVESPKRTIIRPRIWVDTSSRARDLSIRVTSTHLKEDVKQLRLQLEKLRNEHENSSHVFQSMISETEKLIIGAIEAVMPVGDAQMTKAKQRQKMRNEEDAYQRRSENAEITLRRLENEIEKLREAIVNYHSNVKQSELDNIESLIEDLQGSIDSLKSHFDALIKKAKVMMVEEKHSLHEEERFFKEESLRLSHLINRCRHATGNLATLRNLASSQQDAKELPKNQDTSFSVACPIMRETDTIKRAGNYRRLDVVVKHVLCKPKVQHDRTTTASDYNDNVIPTRKQVKTTVRFDDSSDRIIYNQ